MLMYVANTTGADSGRQGTNQLSHKSQLSLQDQLMLASCSDIPAVTQERQRMAVSPA